MDRKKMIADIEKKFLGKKAHQVLSFYPSYHKKKFDRWVEHDVMEVIRLFVDGRSMDWLGEKYGVPKAEVGRALKEYGVNSLLRRKGGGIRKTCLVRELPESFDAGCSSFGYILGVLHGDGCISNDTFRFTSVDKDFMECVIRHLKLCGFTVADIRTKYIRKRRTIISPSTGNEYTCKPYYSLAIYSKYFVRFMDKFNLDDMNHEQEVEFVNGFADSECSINTNGCVMIHNSDPQLLERVHAILEGNHVYSNLTLRRRGTVLISGKISKDMYGVRIGVNNLPIFNKIFRISIERKNVRMQAKLKKIDEKHQLNRLFGIVAKRREELAPLILKFQ